MAEDFLLVDAARAKYPTKNIEEFEMDLYLRVDGPNIDMSEIYFWHINFGHYLGKGYQPFKFEDNHYFSETSQFGANYRQIKGNAIRAFQENFQQLITLIRQHLIPLLKEIKEAHMYKKWFDRISISDALIQKEKSKSSPDKKKLDMLRAERNEAVNHLKDKWMSEVDGGRIWQLHKPQTEQGLDFAMLPQLFIGINLDDPLQRKKTIKEQLDEDIYPLDVSYLAKEQVARFMYKFYTWLPTALKDVELTFKLKIAALKNIYAQTQMYINFMKPLLLEINKETEAVGNLDPFKDYEDLHPQLANLLDASFSNIKLFWINSFVAPRGKNELKDLDFTQFGLFVKSHEIIEGPFKGKKGFLAGEVNPKEKDASKVKYYFYPSDKRDITSKEFREIKKSWKSSPKYVYKIELRKLTVIEQEFAQTRRMENFYHDEAGNQVPYTRNSVNYRSGAMCIYDIASYRESLKIDNLKIMESFIQELAIIREDLLAYVNYVNEEDQDAIDEHDFFAMIKPNIKDSDNSNSSKNSSSDSSNLLLDPFMGLFDIVKPIFSVFKLDGSSKSSSSGGGSSRGPSNSWKRDRQHLVAMLKAVDDSNTSYEVFKKIMKLP